MKKWVISGFLLIIVYLLFMTVHTLNQVIAEGKVVDANVIRTVLKNTPLKMVTETDQYFGTKRYIILYGKDDREQDMVLWLGEDGSVVKYEYFDKAVTREEIKNKVSIEYGVTKPIHITPGIEEGRLLWEVLYRTNEGDFHYIYYDFYKGTFIRSLKMKNPQNLFSNQ